jgi:hypothetical protein
MLQRRFGRIVKRRTVVKKSSNANSKKNVVDSDHEEDEDDDEYDEEGKENVACQREKNLDYVNTNSSNYKIKLNDDSDDCDSSTASVSEEGTCTTFLTSMGEDVFITDITSGVVTVTIKECVSPEGFFKKRLLEKDL